MTHVTMFSTKKMQTWRHEKMTQINITINLEDLKEKVENSSLESPVKSSLSLILNSLMEKERDEYINAFPHERTVRSEEHTSELQSRGHLVCRLLLEKKK